MAITCNSRGGALLAVLWLSAALAAIAFSLANTVRGEAERTSTAMDGTRAYYLATGGIERTIVRVIWKRMNPGVWGRFFEPGTSFIDYQFPTGAVRVEVIPETAKLNINTAPPEELFRLISALGVDPVRAREIVLAILDWRNPRGEESPSEFDLYYASLYPTFRPHHASFQEIEELLLMRGMTPDIYYGSWESAGATEGRSQLVRRTGIADCVSVFGSPGPLDINTAEAPAMIGAGIPLDAAASIVERRKRQPFTDVEVNALKASGGPGYQRLRTGGNTIYTLRSTARLRLPDGRLSDLRRTVAALVKFMPAGYDAPYHVLRWYDTAWSK